MTQIVILLVTVVAVFSVQNATPVGVITFLFWKFEANLAVVIFLSLLAGLLNGDSYRAARSYETIS